METLFINSSIFNPETKLDQKEYKSNKVIANHVKWITKPGRSTIAKIAIAALECLALTLSFVGIYFIYRGIAEYIKLQKVKAFEKSEKSIPPDLKEFPLISKKVTFNHTNYYVIHEGVIWTKPTHNTEAEWKPIYYDGKNPIELQTDGANLIVIDEDRNIHYKKVIKEWRDQSDDHYCYADKSTKNNWKNEWFSLPVFHHVANIFTGKLLKIPEGSRAWAISHRSAYNNYQTDAINQKHVEPIGTTQLYILDAKGEFISIYDPWIHKSANIQIPVPNSNSSIFEAVNISASASTVMLIGHETTDAGNGKVKQELKVYTQFVDVDILGWNPGVKYDYPGNNPSSSARVIPMPGYQEHPLNIPEGGKVTSNIRIVQNGEGNNSRSLIVEGTNSKGESGYYWKQINDDSWQFTENSHQVGDPLDKEQIVEGKIYPEVKDYTGEVNGVRVKLEKYGDQNYLFNLKLEKEGETVQLVFNKRKTLLTFLGLNLHKYEIALPETVPESMKETLKKLFGDKKVVEASFSKTKDGKLKIKAKKLSVQVSPDL